MPNKDTHDPRIDLVHFPEYQSSSSQLGGFQVELCAVAICETHLRMSGCCEHARQKKRYPRRPIYDTTNITDRVKSR